MTRIEMLLLQDIHVEPLNKFEDNQEGQPLQKFEDIHVRHCTEKLEQSVNFFTNSLS